MRKVLTILDTSIINSYDKIYETDLVYIRNCWTLCGDAHCCSFSRYKAKFNFIARSHFQELPLLPYEYEYLAHKGWLTQFGDFDHKVIDYPLDNWTMKIESIISRRPNCACNHETRPTVCKLYPLLPVFDLEGRVIGIDSFGVYEELEEMDNLEPACKLTSLPFEELKKFLLVTGEIGRNPTVLFYISAYRIAKQHIRVQLSKARAAKSTKSSFSLFETALIRNQLINHSELKAQFNTLANRFREQYGSQFELP